MSSPYDDLGDVVPEPKPEPKPEEKPVAKPITKSKTFWVNLLAGAASVITLLTNSDLLADNPEIAGIGGAVLAVINVVLRFVTKEPVKVS